jgi:hypothetical protein
MVQFRTSDIEHDHISPKRFFSFSLTGATPPYRIAVQFDIDNGDYTAYVNGVQGLTGDLLLPPANSRLKFVRNEYAPFMIGNASVSNPLNGITGVDLRLYGLRLSNAIRYQNNGPGTPQKRIDSPPSPVNDAYAFFATDAHTICSLKCTDDPATSGRVVSVQHGTVAVVEGVSSGYFLHAVYPSAIYGNAIRDIQVTAGLGYGQAISTGNALELTIENVKAISGYHGIGSIVAVANYIIYLSHCFLDGTDSAYFGYQQIVFAKDIYCAQAGRATIRMIGGDGDWHNVFVGFPGPETESIVKLYDVSYGGTFTFRNLFVDFEGATLSKAAIYCEASHGAPATSLVLKDINLGTVGPLAPLVMLKDTWGNNPQVRPGWLSVDNLQVQSDTYLAAVDVDGPGWHGEVVGVALTGPQFNHRQRWGSTTGIVIRDTKYVGPPRRYLWYYGAHVLEVRSPADGQFIQWRCVATGTYGTPNPPLWLGLNPLTISSNGLAGYVLNHAYMSIVLS